MAWREQGKVVEHMHHQIGSFVELMAIKTPNYSKSTYMSILDINMRRATQ